MQRTTSGAAGIGLNTTIKYMRRAAGIGLGTKIKYLRRTASGTAGNGLGTMIKYLRRTASGTAGNGLGTMIKYLRRTASADAANILSTTISLLCSGTAFVVNTELHTWARPSVRLCVGPDLARCVHNEHSKRSLAPHT
jgi:hypothetical protein